MIRVYYTVGDFMRNGSYVGRKLLRYAMSENYGITLSDDDISYHDGGKPYLPNYPNVHFNISHTSVAAAVAVSDDPVGIDVQAVSDAVFPRITERLFFGNERNYVGDDPERFFEIWTMKESYAKLTGEGITKRFAETDVLDGSLGVVFIRIEIPKVSAHVCSYTACTAEIIMIDEVLL